MKKKIPAKAASKMKKAGKMAMMKSTPREKAIGVNLSSSPKGKVTPRKLGGAKKNK